MIQEINNLLIPYKGKKFELIPVLQKIQEKFGYISEEAISLIAKFLGVSEAEVFGVATFYNQFKFNPPATHNIKVCLGTACHVRGGPFILEEFSRILGIKNKETTPDKKFSIETVNCVGCCAIGPIVIINDEYYEGINVKKVKPILLKYK